MPQLSITRHQHLINPAQFSQLPIHIIGLGATGSRVLQSLIQLGFTNIHGYDGDIVEAHNIANQAYLHRDIGQPKAHACLSMYKNITGHSAPEEFQMHYQYLTVDPYNPGWFSTPDSLEQLKGVVFLLTDSMESRKDLFDQLIARSPGVLALIETRMASTHGEINVVNTFSQHEKNKWRISLTNDDPETTEMSPCGTSISVGPTAAIIANYAVWQFINLLTEPQALRFSQGVFLKPTMLTRTDAL